MTKIRIIRAFKLIDEIPFTRTYYPEIFANNPQPDPMLAVGSEQQRPQKFKMEEFAALLDSTPEDSKKFEMREIIEVVE